MLWLSDWGWLCHACKNRIERPQTLYSDLASKNGWNVLNKKLILLICFLTFNWQKMASLDPHRRIWRQQESGRSHTAPWLCEVRFLLVFFICCFFISFKRWSFSMYMVWPLKIRLWCQQLAVGAYGPPIVLRLQLWDLNGHLWNNGLPGSLKRLGSLKTKSLAFQCQPNKQAQDQGSWAANQYWPFVEVHSAKTLKWNVQIVGFMILKDVAGKLESTVSYQAMFQQFLSDRIRADSVTDVSRHTVTGSSASNYDETKLEVGSATSSSSSPLHPFQVAWSTDFYPTQYVHERSKKEIHCKIIDKKCFIRCNFKM